MSGLIRQADETMKILMQIEDAATQLEVLASCDAKAQSTTVYTGNLHDLVGELINFLPVCFDSVVRCVKFSHIIAFLCCLEFRASDRSSPTLRCICQPHKSTLEINATEEIEFSRYFCMTIPSSFFKSMAIALFRKCLQQLYNASVDMLQRAVHFHREFCKNKEMLKALNMKRMVLSFPALVVAILLISDSPLNYSSRISAPPCSSSVG